MLSVLLYDNRLGVFGGAHPRGIGIKLPSGPSVLGSLAYKRTSSAFFLLVFFPPNGPRAKALGPFGRNQSRAEALE